MPTFSWLKPLVVAALLATGTARATNTAFWQPYAPDEDTLFLEAFDAAGPGTVAEGRFGGAWQGPAPFRQTDPQFLVVGNVALECWVRLDRLPEKRAYPLRRLPEVGRTRGFELFVEPSGAFGVAVQDCQGRRAELIAPAATVPVGAWTHLAGISMTATYCALFVNGQEVKRQALSAQSGLAADGQKESAAAPIVVGEDVPGLLDQVRVHTRLTKFWPRPEQVWIGARKEVSLPPAAAVFAPGHEPVLYQPFEGNCVPAIDLKKAKINGKGDYVDGVRGRAFRGKFSLSGPVAGAAEGAIEFWCRPVTINNWADKNVTLVSNNLFAFYIFNGGGQDGFLPLSLYYHDKEKHIHFAQDQLATDIYPDKWDHYLFTWSNGKVEYFINGRKAGGTNANFADAGLTGLQFNPNRFFGDIDELYVYDRGLSAVEAANAYWRYIDPAKLQTARAKLADLRFWSLPSTRELYAQVTVVDPKVAQAPVQLQLKDAAGKVVFTVPAAFAAETQHFVLPDLASGDYALNLKIGDEESDAQPLKRQRFAWENSRLGITDEVFPPFAPIKAGRRDVAVVLREQRMNDFGLWDSVVAKGRELLAAPIRLVAVDENGKELTWKGQVKRVSAAPNRAVYQAESQCPAVNVSATSEVEIDGMMKVTLRLTPVPQAVGLARLSLEIPLKDEAAPLLHEVADTIRSSYSGAMPAGQGEIWTSRQSFRQPVWLNAFTGYIWMGGPERGLAWFAENDRGWRTAKNQEQPLMRITREQGRVTLRVDLVNVPGVIARPTELVFGLQASPTRPVPADYRTKAITLPAVGLAVHPWGGLSCSWKSPWMDKWEVVDKVIEGRNGGKVDRAWFEAFQKQYDVPKMHGINDWVADVCRFAGGTTPLTSPDPVYFEEMAVLPFIPEYQVFQDEWSQTRLPEKTTATVDIFRNTGGREINPNARVNFCRSYQDYTLSLMNEWMRRGVTMYWDNTYLKVSDDSWTSAAYIAADGRIQPATTLWNQRQYMQRTWNLMNYWRRQGTPRPLEFVAHMTNANLLPLFSWSTCNYDIEMSQSVYANAFPDSYRPGEPYTPEFLLAESTGLQVGAYPYIVHTLFSGQSKLPDEALGPAPAQVEVGRREWGMRMVHEIISGGPGHYVPPGGLLNKAVYEFGYGRPGVDVWRYWDDTPAFTIEPAQVKGLLLTRRSDRRMLLVLQSWSREPVTATVAFQPKGIGFAPGRQLYDAFRNDWRQRPDDRLEMKFDFPYETRVCLLTDTPPAARVLFAEDFNLGLSPGWDYLPHYATLDNGALRLGENRAPWQGPPRLYKWLALPDFTAGELVFAFRIERVPAVTADVVNVRFPADGIDMSPHGLTHSFVKGGIELKITADPKRGFVWRASRFPAEKKTVLVGEGVSGGTDTNQHQVRIAISATGTYTVTVDGASVIAAEGVPVTVGSAFGFAAGRNPADDIGALWLDDVVLRADQADPTRLEAEYAKAKSRSAEVLAAQVNELGEMLRRVFGVHEAPALEKLALFRRPEADIAELLQRFRTTTDMGQKRALLTLLPQLPAREKEHVAAMQTIGQPADRLPQFRAARTQGTAQLKELQATADARLKDPITETLRAIETPTP